MPEEDPKKTKEQETMSGDEQVSMLEKLRKEMAEQNETYRKSFETQLAELKAQNEQLAKDNVALQKVLVNSATVSNNIPEEHQKTDEELYQERISDLVKKARGMMELY